MDKGKWCVLTDTAGGGFYVIRRWREKEIKYIGFYSDGYGDLILFGAHEQAQACADELNEGIEFGDD